MPSLRDLLAEDGRVLSAHVVAIPSPIVARAAAGRRARIA